jgi:hypothetical protein
MKRKPIPEIEQLSSESVQLYGVLNNESDLGCVLIASSYLDYSLASLLKRYFVESTLVNKLLDPPGGTVSTFAGRSDLAYCLGLIPKGLYRNLDTVGKIRNAFAHSYLSLTLDSDEIAPLVDSFIPPTLNHTIVVDDEVTQPLQFNGSVRDRFNIVAVYMVNRLLVTGLGTRHVDKMLEGWE